MEASGRFGAIDPLPGPKLVALPVMEEFETSEGDALDWATIPIPGTCMFMSRPLPKDPELPCPKVLKPLELPESEILELDEALT